MDKHFKKERIENVQLVSVENPFYQLYTSQFKTEKKVDVVYDKSVPLKSNTMGYLLERTIMDWVKKSGISLPEKIIMYELRSGNRMKRLFKELDYVLQKGNKHYIGEVKVSSQEKGNISKARVQLTESKQLLSKITGDITLQIIRIDLNFKNATEPFDEFNPDFLKMKFRNHEMNGQSFKLLYLSAKDVFNYGVANGTIKSPEIFEPVVYETNLIHQRRQSKEDIKEKKKALLEIGNVDELDMVQSEIAQLEKKIFLDTIKIDLSQQGWVYLAGKTKHEYDFIMNYLGETTEYETQSSTFFDRTNGFGTAERKIKFVSYYNLNDKKELQLLDAERVYLRLADAQRLELLRVNFTEDGAVHPLLSKDPVRKFYYSNKFLSIEDSENKSLQQFEHVIRVSQTIKIELDPGSFLIFDNHRMLHNKENVGQDGWLSKVIFES